MGYEDLYPDYDSFLAEQNYVAKLEKERESPIPIPEILKLQTPHIPLYPGVIVELPVISEREKRLASE